MTKTSGLISAWMSSSVYTVKPKDPLVDAFELMRIHRIRHVPVVDKGRLVGIVSDRDVRQAMPARSKAADSSAAYGKVLMETPVEKAMTRKPITVTPDASLDEAAEIICREKIGALPVEADGRLVGIISAEDLLWAFHTNPHRGKHE
jgi:acetoin utilization protein AcuB